MLTDDALDALRALGQEHRLEAFRCLVQAGAAGLSVGELRGRLDIPAATLSAHLKVLRTAGLVQNRRNGRVIHVSADFTRMNGLVDFLTDNCCGGEPCRPDRSATP
jgi:ArsR family transcriptional regulator, arsenate/arsenite/antimonite-responsive transcriptional repressor